MDFVCKKTTDLSEDELIQISELFESIFEKKRSADFLQRQYINNVLGYSYHSLIVDNRKIVGVNSYVPVYYCYNGEKLLFVNSVDSMVAKSYRDYFNYQDMVETAYDYLRKERVAFVYGYPNDNAYPVLCKSKLMRPIGRMRVYCLPYRMGGVKPVLKWLNPFSCLFTHFFVFISSVFSSCKKADFLLRKDLESYNETRYKRGDRKYTIIGGNENGFVYKVMEYEGVRCAFLIDVYSKSSKAFNEAISYILREEKKNFDLLLYPGYLPFNNTSLIKLPIKLEPKNFNMMGFALDHRLNIVELFTLGNWDTNLSNYDLL